MSTRLLSLIAAHLRLATVSRRLSRAKIDDDGGDGGGSGGDVVIRVGGGDIDDGSIGTVAVKDEFELSLSAIP